MAQKNEPQEEAELALLGSEESDGSDSITDVDDLEAQQKPEQDDAQSAAPEYQTPTTLKFLWITAYFGFSMALTIYNKFILGSVRL